MKRNQFIICIQLALLVLLCYWCYHHPNQKQNLVVVTVTSLLSTILLLKWRNDNSFKNNFWMLTLVILVSGVGLTSGGFSGGKLRLFILLGLFCLAIWAAQKLSNHNRSIFASHLLMLATPYLCLFSTLFLKGASAKFIPMALAPVLACLLFLSTAFLKKRAILKLLVLMTVSYGMAFVLYPQYLAWLMGKQYSQCEFSLADKKLVNEQGQKIGLANLKKKIVLMDFWHSQCRPCFEGFPKIQQLHEQYLSDTNILVMTVNYPLKNDTDSSYLTHLSQYNFQKYKLPSPDDIAAWRIDFYPQIIVFDKNGCMAYKGQLQTEKGLNNIHDLITKLNQQ
jgi:thiol-disulfide isomerase/thioredoxin